MYLLEYIPTEYLGTDDIKFGFAPTLRVDGTGFYLITMFNLFTGETTLSALSKLSKRDLIVRAVRFLFRIDFCLRL